MSEVENVSLGDERFFSFISGLWKGKKPPFKSAAVLRSTNFRGDGLFSFEDVALLDVEERQLDSRQLRPGDIVIERSGGGPKQPVGRVAYFNPPDDMRYATSNFTTVLRVVDRHAFDPEYVCCFLHALYVSGATETLQRATTGIRNLDWGEYQSFRIPRLAIGDQETLAAFIKTAQDRVLIEERQIVALSALKRAAIRTLFTRGLREEAKKETEIGSMPVSWRLVPLGECIAPPDYGFTASASNQPVGPRLLRITDIEDGSVDWAKVPYCSCDSESLKAKRLHRNDIVVARIGATTGKAFLIRDCPEAVFASYLIRLRAYEERVSPQFLYYYMQTEAYWRHIEQNKGGRLKGGVNVPILKALPIPLPEREDQVGIVEVLQAIDRKIDLHRRKRAVLDELFKTLLHKLMTGAIRVADLDRSARASNLASGSAA